MKLFAVALVAIGCMVALTLSATRSVQGAGATGTARTIYQSFGSADGKAMFSVAIHEPAVGGARSLETTIAFINEFGTLDFEQSTRPDTEFGSSSIEIRKGVWRAHASNSVGSWSQVTEPEQITIQSME